MLKTSKPHAEICYQTALAYLELGWSVIPLWGDAAPERAKAPAVSWASYQQAAPDPNTVRQWFLNDGFPALGVVCGRVSALAVLDFDDPELADSFARSHPDLINTLTVRSGGRGLPHYYFEIPSDVAVRTLRAPGVDFQADGAYVVAPPTSIGGRAWEVVHDAPLRTLTLHDVQRIAAFVAVRQFETNSAAHNPAADLRLVEPMTGALSLGAVHAWYRRLARERGRNNALFHVASFLRDFGWTQTEAVAALEDLHVNEPPARPHAPETPRQRLREAHITIASAYRYQPRPIVKARRSPAPQTALPNSVRERLLQLGHAAAARVLDGLRATGVLPGQVFTERTACHLLRAFGIGRRAVMATLHLLLPSGARLIQRLDEPARADKAGKTRYTKQKKCSFFVRSAKRVKTSHSHQGGRPPAYFIMPDNSALYRALGVRPSGFDPLPTESLASPRQYRVALHRALIARRPGRYSRRWLSERLGVSVWTSRRYDRLADLLVTPTYVEEPIHWKNIARVPPELDPSGPDGIFLVDGAGRRYPPLQAIATRLLARGQRVSLMRQGWNHYTLKFKHALVQESVAAAPALTTAPFASRALSLPSRPSASTPAVRLPERSPTPPLDQADVDRAGEEAGTEPPRRPELYLWLCPDCMCPRLREAEPEPCRCGQSGRWERYPEALWRDNTRMTLWWRARYQRFRDAQRARRRAALGLPPEPPRKRRATSPINRLAQVMAKERDEWVERLRQSPYARFFRNAHQILGMPPNAPEQAPNGAPRA